MTMVCRYTDDTDELWCIGMYRWYRLTMVHRYRPIDLPLTGVKNVPSVPIHGCRRCRYRRALTFARRTAPTRPTTNARREEHKKMRKMSARFECAKKMPPLRHKTTDSFDPRESEVIQWLIQQPDILNYLFDAVRGNQYRESPIVYDSETGTWRGTDYDD